MMEIQRTQFARADDPFVDLDIKAPSKGVPLSATTDPIRALRECRPCFSQFGCYAGVGHTEAMWGLSANIASRALNGWTLFGSGNGPVTRNAASTTIYPWAGLVSMGAWPARRMAVFILARLKFIRPSHPQAHNTGRVSRA